MSAHSNAATSTLAYLTLQDVIWINFQVTRKVWEFDYAKLESAVFHEYGYGGSLDLPAQSARFLKAMLEKKPFTEGNAATAFVATLTLLRLNGFDAPVSDAKGWLNAGSATLDAQAASETHGERTVEQVAEGVLATFRDQLTGLD